MRLAQEDVDECLDGVSLFLSQRPFVPLRFEVQDGAVAFGKLKPAAADRTECVTYEADETAGLFVALSPRWLQVCPLAEKEAVTSLSRAVLSVDQQSWR